MTDTPPDIVVPAAFANALAVQCTNVVSLRNMSEHVLNATELHDRQCKCGAKVVIEEVKQ